MFELENSHFWFLAKRDFFRSIFPRTKHKVRIFDIGCGTGGMSKYLENWGTVDRIEQSAYAEKYLKLRGLSYIKTDINNYNTPKNKYDLVCIFDVLYHKKIKNINTVFKKVFMALKENGRLVITDCALPIFQSHHDKIMMANKRFYLNEMVTYLERAGFIVEKQSYTYFFLLPFFIFSRFIDKLFPSNTVFKLPQIINSLMYRVCKFESYLLRYVSFPLGSSIIVKAKKCTIKSL